MRKLLLQTVVMAVGTAAWAQPSPAKDISFGGQLRSQFESTNIEAYTSIPTRRGKDSLGLRTRLWAKAKAAQGMDAFIQFQDSRYAGQETSVATNDHQTDLHQGYLALSDLFGKPVDLTVGRMELKYGDQRLISPLDWSIVGRAWDGVLLRGRLDSVTVDGFFTNVKETASARRDQNFWGLYATCKAVKDHEFDAYVLGRDYGNESQAMETRTTDKGNLSDRTIGARAKGKTGPADYSGEAAWQVGRKAGMPVRAWAGAATAGWTFPGDLAPRLGVEYDYATGDKDPTDDHVNGFDPLFPFGHALQGYQDIFTWKNGHAFKLSGSVTPMKGTTFFADYHYFRLDQAKDAWYNAALAAVARDAAGRSGREVGQELDLHMRTAVRGALKLWLGYSHFFKSSVVKSLAGGRDRDWAFLQATLDF
ncbi:MAG: alginate export family protein [Elusimicrobia bacterium]|nr:alginate export family protein [Elusimicrobiota bacterium]